MVVLDKVYAAANGSFELLVVKAFEEESTIVPEHFWLKDEYVGNCGLNYVHDNGLIRKWGITPQVLMVTT
ncbi:hypothetical protein KU15F71_41510 [Escherichia coli]|nr:hypothetical protein VEE42_44550 [Escherichia coli]BEC07716.1 hypothetical protein VEE25_42680 [Escherichia coli]